MNEKSLLIINKYPKDQYNSLIPIETVQEVSNLHKIIINQVTLNVAEDTYPQNGKKALKKEALLKLMAAANVRVKSSKPVMPSTTRQAIEMAKAIGQPVDYDKRDVAYEVTLEVPDMNGGYREVVGSKELIASDIEADVKAIEFKQIMKHRVSLCETKAMLRAVRAALTIKAVYTEAELKKPFIVAIVVPNADNKLIQQAIANRMTQSMAMLFGNDAPVALPQNDHIAIEMKDDASIEEGYPTEDITDEEIEGAPFEDDGLYCQGCGQEILETSKHTAQQIADYSAKRLGKALCLDCQKEIGGK